MHASQGFAHESGRLATADGVELFWQQWLPHEPRGVIVLVHGLADHSDRFVPTAEYFARLGWLVCACDLRGHGLSSDGLKPGRVHVDHFDDYALDIDAMIKLVDTRFATLPKVLLGHSMGGLIALRYVLAKPDLFAGAVISSPALGAHPDTLLPKFTDWLVRMFARVSPRLLFPSDLDSSAISHDPEVVRDYVNDKLVSHKVSARWYTSINHAIEDIQIRAAQLRVPTLMMIAGDDRLVDAAASQQWAGNAPKTTMELVVWDGLYHEIFNEPEKDKVRACMAGWLQKTIPGQAGR